MELFVFHDCVILPFLCDRIFHVLLFRDGPGRGVNSPMSVVHDRFMQGYADAGAASRNQLVTKAARGAAPLRSIRPGMLAAMT
jgi:hypothetical protein